MVEWMVHLVSLLCKPLFQWKEKKKKKNVFIPKRILILDSCVKQKRKHGVRLLLFFAVVTLYVFLLWLGSVIEISYKKCCVILLFLLIFISYSVLLFLSLLKYLKVIWVSIFLRIGSP